MSTLTDRYVHAATRFVQDETERRELALEVRERIADAVDARLEGGAGAAEAERATLVELGDPLRLSASYRQRPAQLIGPRFYFTWLRVVVIGLATVPAINAVVVALVGFSTGAGVGEVIGDVIPSALGVAVQVAFWVTLFFAVADRVAPAAQQDVWTPDLLPELPSGSRSHRRTDAVASVVVLVLLGVLVVWQQLASPVIADDGTRVPVLDPGLWSLWLPLFLLLVVAECVHAVWVYREGWTWRVAAVNAVLAVAPAAALVWLLDAQRVLNPDLLALVGGGQEWFGTATRVTIAVIVVGAVVDVVTGFVKAARAGRSTSDREPARLG